MKVKNIIFDMGGVLINLDQQRCMDSFKKLGFKDIETYIDPYTQECFFSDFETGNMSNEEFFESHRRGIRSCWTYRKRNWTRFRNCVKISRHSF